MAPSNTSHGVVLAFQGDADKWTKSWIKRLNGSAEYSGAGEGWGFGSTDSKLRPVYNLCVLQGKHGSLG